MVLRLDGDPRGDAGKVFPSALGYRNKESISSLRTPRGKVMDRPSGRRDRSLTGLSVCFAARANLCSRLDGFGLTAALRVFPRAISSSGL